MGTKTDILWTDHTQNLWWGCFKVSEECKNCYAETFAKRVGKHIWGPAANTDRWILSESNFKKPLAWNKQAQAEGRRHRVFCSSMSDVFEDHPAVTETRKRLWDMIEQTTWLDWQLLTKRPENIMSMAPWGNNWPENVWAGTSVGSQTRAIERIPELLKVPAKVRFLSCEPLLEAVDLTPWLSDLQWIICGGESGPRHRPFNPEWARSLRNQCLEANIPFFFKQHGGFHHDSGGNLLDGQTYQQFPKDITMTPTYLQQGFEGAITAYPNAHISGTETVWVDGLFDDDGEEMEIPHTWQLVNACEASFYTPERKGKLVLREDRPSSKHPRHHWGYMIAKSDIKIEQPV